MAEEKMGTKILAGKFKAGKIKTLPGFSTRPLLARVKKSLFDILGQKIKNARFLDLYAGTGNVGIESLSRGAKNCWFVEKDRRCVGIIKENLASLGTRDFCRIFQADTLKFLAESKQEFDIIFVGPPYRQNLVQPTLEIGEKRRILTKRGWIICQHHRHEELPEEVGKLHQFRKEVYGDIALTFYKYFATETRKGMVRWVEDG